MRAAGLDFETKSLREFELTEPGPPGPGEALLRIAEVGICATDRELSHFRFGAPPPGETVLALGHEALARVEQTGAGAGGVSPGDWVVPMLRRPCAVMCRACAKGRIDCCVTGRYQERGIVASHGYLTEWAVDPACHLVRVPESLLDRAVLIEPLSVVEKALDTAWRSAQLPPRTALVIGAGPVGLLTVQALVLRGLRVGCTSLEPAEHPRARLAAAAGARYAAVGETSPPADLIIEASGSRGGLDLAFSLMGPLSVLVLIGAAETQWRFNGVRAVVENWTIVGVVNAARPHFEMAVRDLAAFDRALVLAMINRRSWRHWRESVLGHSSAIKAVHPLH